MQNVASAAIRVTPRSQASRAERMCALRVVPLGRLPQIVEELAAGQALGLHALDPIILEALQARAPALPFLLGHLVDRPARLLDRCDALVLVLVPHRAGELGTPGAAELIDYLAQVRREAVVPLLVHVGEERRDVEADRGVVLEDLG